MPSPLPGACLWECCWSPVLLSLMSYRHGSTAGCCVQCTSLCWYWGKAIVSAASLVVALIVCSPALLVCSSIFQMLQKNFWIFWPPATALLNACPLCILLTEPLWRAPVACCDYAIAITLRTVMTCHSDNSRCCGAIHRHRHNSAKYQNDKSSQCATL